MPDISIVIVNFNVRYFIEQAILSIKKASSQLEVEIIVVDNASSDHSVELLAAKFPEITLIANKENVGFGRANNQGIALAKAKYILLLNPDTVLQENTLSTCISFMKQNAQCGAIGVKMIDGKGNFLPESKRSLPTPKVAFYKIFGLAALFPNSKRFGKYHLNYLDENKNHEVEVLSGAFMFFDGDLLKEIGGFDEDYFMYGEDIDLSFQVIKQGYKNYYLSDTSIIHYKGESTKKGSLNYVKVFYEAMLIFAKKHYSPNQAKLYSFAIYAAIFLKGFFTLSSNYLKKLSLPFLDSLFSYLGTLAIALTWGFKIKESSSYYPTRFFTLVIPCYVLIWFLSVLISGAYEKPYKTSRIWKGIFMGTLVIAAIYGFLPESLRFSRAIILLGALLSSLTMLMNRLFYHKIFHKKFVFELNDVPNLAIVGNAEESVRALLLLKENLSAFNFIGFISASDEEKKIDSLGTFNDLNDLVKLYKIEELIFCSKDVSPEKIIGIMTELGSMLNYKILPEKSVSIIGSNSKNSAGDLYAIDVNLKIASPRSRISKRSFDLALMFYFLFTLPITLLFVENKLGFIRNLLAVLKGELSWVGYDLSLEQDSRFKLPKIKKGVLSPRYYYENKKGLNLDSLNLLYAKNYSISFDIQIILKGFSLLGLRSI